MAIIDMNKIGEALNTKADIDLNNTGVFSTSEGGVVNLTSSTPADASGKEVTSADFFQSNLLNYTTNRILEIPQDIKLELNNGTLTLKAGSKVYVPNGFEADGTTPKFDAVVISSDLTNTVTINNSFTLTVYGNKLAPFLLSQCFSGENAPVSPSTGTLWYDTVNNKIKVYSNSIWYERNDCLPIAILTSNNNSYTSIDQVFNGFGYIGSTVFALPGVKVQIPNGRNTDGTCKSIIATVDSVKTTTRTDSVTIKTHWYLVNNLSLFSSSGVSFDADKNIYVSPTGVIAAIEIANGYFTSGKITSFTPYTVDSVANSNEFYQLKDKAVTTDSAQTISGVKTFIGGTLQALRPILLKEDNANEGGQIHFQRSNNSVLKADPYIDLLTNTIRVIGTNSKNAVNITLQVDLENKQVLVPTPALTANDTQVATTAWVNSKIQLVNELPTNPVAGVLYCIPEA